MKRRKQERSYTRQHKGTGLGLTLTQKLVELHGGRIRVESEGDGKGSTFTFVLPMKPPVLLPSPPSEATDRVRGGRDGGEALTCPSSCSALDTSAGYAPHGAPDRPLILVVEDDHQASWLLSHYLSGAGYAVAQAYDAEEAIRKAREMAPYAITLDILLPGRNGWEMLEELKSAPETRDIPVIVVTITDDQSLGIALGITDFLVKPVSKSRLIEALDKIKGTFRKEDLTVLVIDDEPKTVELLTDVLRSEGFAVLHAYGGRQGIELAIRETPDVIILDLLMPQVTGFEVVQQLREHLGTRDIPILLFTAKELTPEDRQQLAGKVESIASKSGGRERVLRELEALRRKRDV